MEKENSVKNNSNDEKLFSILAYLGVLSLVPYLVEKNNKFVIYHAKQGLNLFILEVIASIGLSILAATIILAPIVLVVSPIIGILSLVLSVIGIVNVCNNEEKELPIVSKIKIIK